jgi:hypothetical protein
VGARGFAAAGLLGSECCGPGCCWCCMILLGADFPAMRSTRTTPCPQLIISPPALCRCPCPAVHFEDQLSSEKKCGHLGGKVLVPTQQAVRNLVAGGWVGRGCRVWG